MTTETDLLHHARTGATLAQLMIANRAELADMFTEQAAEVVTEAEQITAEAVELAEIAPCTEGSCLHAHPASPCECTTCWGAGHGHATLLKQNRGRATMATRIERAGGVFGTLPAMTDPAPTVYVTGPFNPNPIIIDGEEW